LFPEKVSVRVREQVGRKSSPYDSEDKEVSRTKMRFYSTALVMVAIVMMLAMTLLITTS